MNIKVIGAGALGMLFAAKLSAVPGIKATLVCRTREQAGLLNGKGITLRENGVEISSHPHCVSFNEMTEDAVHTDWIFLCVKQKDISHQLITMLHAVLGSDTPLLCFQNGIGHVEKLVETIDASQIYIAATTEAAKRLSAHAVEHTGKGSTKVGKAFEQGEDWTSNEKLLINFLKSAGFESLLSKNTLSIVWNKLLINDLINPLTALMRVRNGTLPSSRHALLLMERLFHEGARAAELAGVQIDGNLWEQILEVCSKTAGNHSSMLQDVLNGRQTEADWITGSILHIMEQNGEKAPVHEVVYHLLKGLESGDIDA